jgi:hypothetical protein
MRIVAVVAVLAVLPAFAHAQTPDPRWSAWLGCWELVLERARESSPAPGRPGSTAAPLPNNARPQICVEPTATGASFTTRVGTETSLVQTVVADGADHPIVDADCRGTQRTLWSQNGRRLYSSASLTCGADPGRRTVSGLAILGPDGTWTDVQAVSIGGQETVRVRRYRRATGTAQATRPRLAGAPLTIEDVMDAGSKVSPRALEAALVETGSAFELSGRELIALQDAGVPASVTDLMVALSYPDRFVVERNTRDDRAPFISMIDDPFLLGWSFGYPMWSDGFGFYSPFYGSYSSYFYSPFSYSYLRYYDPRYFGAGSVVVIGDGGGGIGVPNRPSGSGRVVDGQGYTRVRPREADNPPATQAASGGTSSSSGGGSSSSSSGGGGSVSSQGFSSGGGSSDGGGRTAQPR